VPRNTTSGAHFGSQVWKTFGLDTLLHLTQFAPVGTWHCSLAYQLIANATEAKALLMSATAPRDVDSKVTRGLFEEGLLVAPYKSLLDTQCIVLFRISLAQSSPVATYTWHSQNDDCSVDRIEPDIQMTMLSKGSQVPWRKAELKAGRV